MISAMPAVAVRRERKKQRAAAAAAASASGSCSSRGGSLSSLPSPSTRSSSLPSSPLSSSGNYYNYFASQRPASARRPSSVSAASTSAGGGGRPPPSRRPSASGVSTISSAASNYVSALHKVRERQLAARRERARFLAHTGSVLLASGAALAVIGLAARAANALAVGLLFLCLGCGFWLARVLCLAPREEAPLARRGASRQSMYAPSTAHQSAATTPGTDDSSTTSSYYFSAVPLHRGPQQPSPLQSPEAPPAAAPPPLRPPPVVPGVRGAGGGHRGTSASLLTPMSLDSIPEMQVLITDDSQRY